MPSITERSALFVKELSFLRRRQTDDAFSTGTGLELARIARPIRCLWMLGSSAKTRYKKDRRGLNCLGNEVLCICLRTFHRWGDLVFIMDDHDNFPSWMMTQNSIFPC